MALQYKELIGRIHLADIVDVQIARTVEGQQIWLQRTELGIGWVPFGIARDGAIDLAHIARPSQKDLVARHERTLAIDARGQQYRVLTFVIVKLVCRHPALHLCSSAMRSEDAS